MGGLNSVSGLKAVGGDETGTGGAALVEREDPVESAGANPGGLACGGVSNEGAAVIALKVELKLLEALLSLVIGCRVFCSFVNAAVMLLVMGALSGITLLCFKVE
jgi:hypothetical protein